MNIAEAGGDGKVWADLGEGTVDIENVLRLSVKRVVVDALVVDAIFFTTSDTNFLS